MDRPAQSRVRCAGAELAGWIAKTLGCCSSAAERQAPASEGASGAGPLVRHGDAPGADGPAQWHSRRFPDPPSAARAGPREHHPQIGAVALRRHVRDRRPIENSWHRPRGTTQGGCLSLPRDHPLSDHVHASKPGDECVVPRSLLVGYLGPERLDYAISRHQRMAGDLRLARSSLAESQASG